MARGRTAASRRLTGASPYSAHALALRRTGMKPIAVLLLAWWFVMHATGGPGSGSQPLVVGPFQDKSVSAQERLYWRPRGFGTSLQCFQGGPQGLESRSPRFAASLRRWGILFLETPRGGVGAWQITSGAGGPRGGDRRRSMLMLTTSAET